MSKDSFKLLPKPLNVSSDSNITWASNLRNTSFSASSTKNATKIEIEEPINKDLTDQSTSSTSNSVKSDILINDSTSSSTSYNHRDRPSSCVFVASLSATMSDDDISVSVSNCFSKWGKLTTVKVLRDNKNRPYAFVQYNNDESASKAIEEAHSTVLDGRNIRCERAKVNRTIFIANNNLSVEKEVINEMSKFGEIESILPATSRGNLFPQSDIHCSMYWFIKFAYREDAISAYANLKINNSKQVEWAQNIDEEKELQNLQENEQANQSASIDKFSIFVGQINPTVTQEALKDRFGIHGTICDIVMSYRQGKNFAFIKFKDESSAARAVEKENHAMLENKTLNVQYRELYNSKYKSNAKVQSLFLAPPPINFNRKSKGNSFDQFPLSNTTNKKQSRTFFKKSINEFGENNEGFYPQSSLGYPKFNQSDNRVHQEYYSNIKKGKPSFKSSNKPFGFRSTNNSSDSKPGYFPSEISDQSFFYYVPVNEFPVKPGSYTQFSPYPYYIAPSIHMGDKYMPYYYYPNYLPPEKNETKS